MKSKILCILSDAGRKLVLLCICLAFVWIYTHCFAWVCLRVHIWYFVSVKCVCVCVKVYLCVCVLKRRCFLPVQELYKSSAILLSSVPYLHHDSCIGIWMCMLWPDYSVQVAMLIFLSRYVPNSTKGKRERMFSCPIYSHYPGQAQFKIFYSP